MSHQVIIGDCLTSLRSMASESVNCCVTSPPYFGLRDYGHDGQLGLESTPEEYVAKMVEVFREVRRVLRDDGTLWLNLGDSYNAYNGNRGTNSKYAGNRSDFEAQFPAGHGLQVKTLKQKDLIGIPWMLAKALRDPYYTGRIKDECDRVWLAAVIDGEGCFFIHKRKAGTPSYSKHIRANGTKANYTRTADTYGVGLEISNTSKRLIDRVAEIVPGGTFTTQGPEQNGRRKQIIYRWRLSPNDTKRLAQELYPHLVAKQHQARLIFSCPSSGNAGAAAHQAMMDLHNGAHTDVDFPAPSSLFEPGFYLRQDIIWGKPNPMPESVTDRCTKAHEYIFLLSKSPRYYFDQEAMKEPAVTGWNGSEFHEGKTADHQLGRSSKNRKPRPAGNKTHKYVTEYEQSDSEQHRTAAGLLAQAGVVYETRNRRSVWTVTTKPYKGAHFAVFPPDLIRPCVEAGCPKDGTVLDPFGGSGTTGQVAIEAGRNVILLEINPDYEPLITSRLRNAAHQVKMLFPA